MTALKSIARVASTIALVALVAGGCSRDNRPDGMSNTSPLAPSFTTTSFVSDDVVINYYNVHFNGRTFENNQTTFSYTVTGTGVDPSLNHFTIELPPCAPALDSYSPTGSANINTNQDSGIYGIEWHLSVAKDNTIGQVYTITFPGDVPLGIVRSEVKTENGAWAVGNIFGPCAGSHITGTVFVDADKSGTKSASESGIANVTVTISNGSSSVNATTDASGNYDFLVADGTYTVTIPSATPAISDFNEDLYASFTAFSATSVTVTVSGDSPNHDFAFTPNTTQLINDFSVGTLLTAGKSAKWWASELRSAGNGSQSFYTTEQDLGFLAQVQAFGLPTPFQFTAGNELKNAINILNNNTKNDYLGLFLKQLLAAELNYFSGNTIIGQADLHEVLILYGEEVAVQPVTAGGITTYATGTNKLDPYSSDTTLLSAINGSTSGGGGDQTP